MVEMFGVLGLQKRGNLLHQHVAHAKIDSVLDKAVHELVSGVIRVSAPHSADALARRPSDHGVWRAAEGDRVDVLSGRQSFSDGFRLVLHQVERETFAGAEEIFVGCGVHRLDIDAGVDVETGLLKAEAETAEAGEKFDRMAAPCRDRKSTSELQSLMRSSYAVICLQQKH